MGCEEQIKEGAVEGLILGGICGGFIGILDSVLTAINCREGGCGINLINRVLAGVINGGALGLIIGAFFSTVKYCSSVW